MISSTALFQTGIKDGRDYKNLLPHVKIGIRSDKNR